MDKEKVILVVEDEKPLADAIRKKLEDNNFLVTTARNAQQAVDYLNELDHIDAIWLDHYLLNGETGFDVLEEVKKEDSKWKDKPVFLISNTVSEDKINKYITFGVEKYYIKANKSLQNIIDDIIEGIE
jgi:two-component system alkaline phosphatase synthesis response regulator PhoP